MAWVTVTYRTGQLIDGTDLNTLRDDFNALAIHGHSGGSGAGATTLTAIVYVDFRSIATAGPVVGSIRVFGSNGTLGWLNSTGTYFAISATHTHAGI